MTLKDICHSCPSLHMTVSSFTHRLVNLLLVILGCDCYSVELIMKDFLLQSYKSQLFLKDHMEQSWNVSLFKKQLRLLLSIPAASVVQGRSHLPGKRCVRPKQQFPIFSRLSHVGLY